MEHPKGTYLISYISSLENCSYFIFAGLLILFMVEVLHFSQAFAALLSGILLGLTYLFQVAGDYLCNNYLGNRKSVLIGIFLIMLAQLILTYDASLYYQTANVATHSALLFTLPEIIFLIGCAVMAIGVGIFKVSSASFIGLFYKDDDKFKDGGLSIYYTFMNIGVFLAPLAINFIVGVHHPEFYQYGFMVAFIVILIAAMLFIIRKNKFLVLENGESVGVLPISKIDGKNGLSEKLTAAENSRLKVIILMLVFFIVYLVGNQQILSSIILFANQYVNNTIPFINYDIAPQLYIALNPLFIIILSPLYIKLDGFLDKKGISSIAKIGLALLVLALAYLILTAGIITTGSGMKISMIWIILYYIFLAISEFLMMPVVLSLIKELAPERYASSMTGAYYVAYFIALVIMGLFAAAIPLNGSTMLLNIIPITSITTYFMTFAVIGGVCGIIWLIFSNKIKKLAN